MKVTVRVFGELAAVIGKKLVVNVPEGSTVLAVTNSIQKMTGQNKSGYLSEFEVGGVDIAIIVNGKNIALLDGVDTVLRDGDDLVIMPFVSGGEGSACEANVVEWENAFSTTCDG